MSEFESYDMTKFLENCEKMNLTLSTEQQQQFVRYYELLVEWNSFMNLTGITDFQEVLQKHFEDSLALVRGVDLSAVTSVMDVGTGAGFPGLPLKIAFPHLKIVLLDSLGKRVKFLNHRRTAAGQYYSNTWKSRRFCERSRIQGAVRSGCFKSSS